MKRTRNAGTRLCAADVGRATHHKRRSPFNPLRVGVYSRARGVLPRAILSHSPSRFPHLTVPTARGDVRLQVELPDSPDRNSWRFNRS